MRVLQVVHALPAATYGGTELYTQWIAEALASEHDVHVATPLGAEAARDAPRGSDANVAGATVHALPDTPGWTDPTGVESGLERDVDDEAVDAAFVDLLESVEPDVVHFQHLKRLSATLPERCRERGVPSVLTLHDFWTMCHREQLHRPDGQHCSGPESAEKCAACYADALEREAVPRAGSDEADDSAPPVEPTPVSEAASDGGDATVDEPPADLEDVGPPVVRRTERLAAAREAVDLLVSPSEFLRETFVEFGTPEDAIVQCRNGVPVARYDELADDAEAATELDSADDAPAGFDPDDGVAFGYAGRIAPVKGVHVLVQAFGAVDGDATLDVFGAFDPDAEEYHAGLRDAAGDDVTFHGWYEDDAAPFREIDVLVVPSLWYENSPLVIQEAFAAGVPVVAGDVGGMAELVTHGEDGLTYATGDPLALAECLQRLVDDPEHVRRLREGVEPPKSVAEHVRELAFLYDVVSDGGVQALAEGDLPG